MSALWGRLRVCKGGAKHFSMNVGPVIENARLARGLSRRALARTLRVHLAQITRWETGETIPNAGILPALCGALHISYDQLLGEPRRELGEWT